MAQDSQKLNEEPEVSTKAPEEVQEDKKTDQVDSTETEQSREDPNARIALDLYNSLNDPAKARDVVKYLAAKAGLQVQETDATTKAAVKDTLADLKEGIDPNLHFLIDGLKPAIEKMVQKSIEPIKQAQLQDKEQLVMAQVNAAYDTMRSRHKDFDKYEGLMNKYAEDFAYKPGQDMVRYLEGIYKLASMETKEGEAVKGAVSRINKNAQQAKVQSAETAEETVSIGSKLPSLREAVNAAVKGVRFTN